MSNNSSSTVTDTGCVPYNTEIDTQYGYQPSEAAGIVFCALFGLSLALHVFQSTYKRQWTFYVFAIGALTEVLGWAARLWAHSCPYNSDAFTMQICTLIIAPTFFTAGIYVILGRLIRLYGRSSSIISEKAYLWIFCTCDLISLIVQAVGGALASIASTSTPPGDTGPGTNIMVGGIIFQLASVTVFTVFFFDFIRRVRNRQISRQQKVLMIATAFSITVIYVRSIYRTIELLQGWSGYLITHEVYFIILDGAMMVLAVGVYNICNPGWLLGNDEYVRGSSAEPLTDLGNK